MLIDSPDLLKAQQRVRLAVLVSNPCVIDARVRKMALAAASAGYEVCVFATAAEELPNEEVVDGVCYRRVNWRGAELMASKGWLNIVRKVNRSLAIGIAKRLVPYTKFRLFEQRFAQAVADFRPDIVHAHDLICLQAAHTAAHVCNARLVYDAHELEVHRHPPLPVAQKWYVSRTEARLASRADAVITVGHRVREVMQSSLSRHDVEVIYNSPLIASAQRTLRADAQLEPSDKVILYVGKISAGRGLERVLEALPAVPGGVLVALGHFERGALESLRVVARRHGVEARFKWLPPVSFDEVVDYIRDADLGVIPVESLTLSYKFCMPNKLFEFAFANVPVLSNVLDDVADFLREHGNGEVVDFLNPSDVARTCLHMLEHRSDYLMDEETRSRLAEVYSWEVQQTKLLGIYARLHTTQAVARNSAPETTAPALVGEASEAACDHLAPR